MTEEETKLHYITPAILQNWNINNIRMEYKTPSKKSCDYALFYNNKLLAIVEAKNINCSVDKGLEQAINYCYELKCPFAYSTNGKQFLEYNLFTQKTRILNMYEFPTPENIRYMANKTYNPIIFNQWNYGYSSIYQNHTTNFNHKRKYNIFLDIFMIIITGGLWLIWMLVRP